MINFATRSPAKSIHAIAKIVSPVKGRFPEECMRLEYRSRGSDFNIRLRFLIQVVSAGRYQVGWQPFWPFGDCSSWIACDHLL